MGLLALYRGSGRPSGANMQPITGRIGPMHHGVIAAWLAITLSSAALSAQQADSTGPLKFTGTIGLVNTAGNSDVTTLNVGDRADYRAGEWGLAQLFNVVYGRNQGVTNTSIWNASLRGDRNLDRRLAV
jgi:hypothetical protein